MSSGHKEQWQSVFSISLDMKDWILVTGGLGYVGSHCVLQILQAGHHVVIIDNLSNASQGQFARLLFLLCSFSHETFRGDQ